MNIEEKRLWLSPNGILNTHTSALLENIVKVLAPGIPLIGQFGTPGMSGLSMSGGKLGHSEHMVPIFSVILTRPVDGRPQDFHRVEGRVGL